MASDRPGFRSDIEGLRGLAILLVVGFHAGVSWLAGGYVGVDVFFVVSGYFITGLLAREISASGDVDLSEFFARRARRLVNAFTRTQRRRVAFADCRSARSVPLRGWLRLANCRGRGRSRPGGGGQIGPSTATRPAATPPESEVGRTRPRVALSLPCAADCPDPSR